MIHQQQIKPLQVIPHQSLTTTTPHSPTENISIKITAGTHIRKLKELGNLTLSAVKLTETRLKFSIFVKRTKVVMPRLTTIRVYFSPEKIKGISMV